MKQETNDNKWLDEIRDELSEFQAEVPANGWERLSSELPVSETSHIAGKKRIIPIWISSSAAAAILLLAGYLIFNHNRPDTGVEESVFEEVIAKQDKTETPESENSISLSKDPEESAPIYSENKKTVYRKKSSSSVTETTVNTVETTPIVNTTEEASIEGKNATETKTEEDVPVIVISVKDLPKTDEEKLLTAMEDASRTKTHNRKKNTSDRWAMGVLLGGNSGANASSGNSLIYAEPKMYSSLLERCQQANLDSSEKTRSGNVNGHNREEVDHAIGSDNHRSWSFGLSVQKQLSERFAIETGLIYSVLSSDVEIASSRAFDIYCNYGTVSQRLQYLGVPLKLNATLFDSNNWRVYANGGTTIERCLSAKREDKSLHTDHWQSSLNAAAGIQYNFSKYLGVYAEPGINYYFDNKTNIPTQRSEQPLMFNINAGVRVNL